MDFNQISAQKVIDLTKTVEKYIKELETSVHLQRTQNAVLRNKVQVDNCEIVLTLFHVSSECMGKTFQAATTNT